MLRKRGCFEILTMLKDEDEQNLKALVQGTGVDRATLTTRLSDLKDYGMIEAIAPEGGVRKKYRITERGASVAKELERVRDSSERKYQS